MPMPGTFGKLGKAPAVHDPRTLRLADYTAAVSRPPREVHRSHREYQWPMFANDRLGDCTCAAAAHMIEGWALETSRAPAAIKDDQVIAAYSAVSGYDPLSGANDGGAVMLDVLRYWRTSGIAGDRISAYVTVDQHNALHVKQAIYLFDSLYIGVALPISAQGQTGGVWDVPVGGPVGNGAPGSWGGHAIPVVSYDSQRLAVITWGAVQVMTWRFFGTYCDEAYAVLSNDMLMGGKSPQGLNVGQLNADLAAL